MPRSFKKGDDREFLVDQSSQKDKTLLHVFESKKKVPQQEFKAYGEIISIDNDLGVFKSQEALLDSGLISKRQGETRKQKVY